MSDRALNSRIDASTFMVIGDGLSAGMGHFSLEGSFQATSFPAQAARALGVAFEQPLFEPPGLGDVVGLEPQPVVVPGVRQSTVLHSLPSAPGLNNLSVPSFDFDDALDYRPTPPLVDRRSNRRTLANFILGLPDLEWDSDRARTQIEYLRHRRPTLTLICLGFDQVFEAAVSRRFETLLTAGAVERRIRSLIQRAQDGCGDHQVVVCTVPNPLHTAYFSTPCTAASILKTTPDFLRRHWQVGASDRIPLRALYAMGYQTMARSVGVLDAEHTDMTLLDESTACTLGRTLDAMNGAIQKACELTGAAAFDLHGILDQVAHQGLAVNGRSLTVGYLGGLYLLNGVYPGPTLNAHIADRFIQWLKSRDTALGAANVSIESIASQDPNTLTETAPGPAHTDAFLRPRTPDELPGIQPPVGPVQVTPIQTTYPQLQPSKAGCTPAVGIPAAGLVDPSRNNPDFQPLHIPADGLDYTLELNSELSCFGDALRPVDCANEPSIIPGFPPFGLCERTFFGGFLPTTSQLSGKVHVKIFTPNPQGQAQFEIRHPGDLHGGPGDLCGPQLFRMPVQHTRAQDIPGVVSSGVLDTQTGRVYNFHYNLQNTNTALYSLIKLNPSLPPAVQSALLTFPGAPNGGSTSAEFTPRADGLFDVSLAGHMFVPLGAGSDTEPLRFALPFTTPDLEAASFIARGTSLHPRIYVTTRPTPASTGPALELPDNRVEELTAHTRATYFGDAFDLHAEAFGQGGATGQSLLLGRVRAQFGARTGDTVPVVFQMLPPGGLLGEAPAPPPFLPPGVSRGGSGFDTVLHFPKLAYPQAGLASPDDPFNVCTATFHLGTGESVGLLLWRGFVVQALFANLIRVEPCTPADSFNYRGTARFERGQDGSLALRWNGEVFLPYPKGFLFPSPGPSGLPAIPIEGDSRLDPFRSVRAVSQITPDSSGVMRGNVEAAQSPATGEKFSYRWSIPFDPERADQSMFEYVSHTQRSTFRLTSLSWLDFSRTLGSNSRHKPQLVTFSGFGIWSQSPDALHPGTLHQVSVQISIDSTQPYVGIQVDGGLISNVDTKPAREDA